MELVPADQARGLKVPVWERYQALVNQAEGTEVRVKGDDLKMTRLL